MAFATMVAELTGVLPGLSPFLAQTYINRAWREIRNKRQWAFLMTDGEVICPEAISSGSIAIVQYASTVLLDADASAAVLAQTDPTAVPGLQAMQIRFGSSPTNGQVYSILSFDITDPTAIVLTLDRAVIEPTNATSAYQCYRCYIVPPIDDFLKWISLVDVTNAIAITGDRLQWTSAYLDRRDPQRAATGLAYSLASYAGNRTVNVVTGATSPQATQNQGTPIYELWPHPTSGQAFYVRFRRKGVDLLQPTDELPPQVDEGLVISRAFYMHAYPFAAANVANFPTFKGANWFNLIAAQKSNFDTLWITAVKQDNEQQQSQVIDRGHGLRRSYGGFKGLNEYPIDSNFIQSHLVRF